MNERTKNWLGLALTVGVIVVAVSAWMYVATYADSVRLTTQRSFTASGEGKIVAVPDVAQFTFTVLTQGGKDIAALTKDNVDKMNAAIAYVKGRGVEAKDIETKNYNLEPRYQYFNCSNTYGPSGSVKPCPPPEIVGYTINQTVSVKVRDFTKVGDILSGVVGAGANTVSNLDFRIDDPAKAQNDTRVKAIAQAKAKAEAVASAGGFSIGRLLSIEEGYSQPMYYRSANEKTLGMGGDSAIAAPAPAIEPGSQEVAVTVYLRYEIR